MILLVFMSCTQITNGTAYSIEGVNSSFKNKKTHTSNSGNHSGCIRFWVVFEDIAHKSCYTKLDSCAKAWAKNFRTRTAVIGVVFM